MATGEAVLGPVSCLRRKTTDRWGPPVSGCAAVQHIDSVRRGNRLGWLWPLGRNDAPVLFSFFLFLSLFFFYFLFCFISFAYFIQINSNKFLNSSNNPSNVLNQ
jgi:hypothetical protein